MARPKMSHIQFSIGTDKGTRITVVAATKDAAMKRAAELLTAHGLKPTSCEETRTREPKNVAGSSKRTGAPGAAPGWRG